jgi:beta-N-acetylhexosaminidase
MTGEERIAAAGRHLWIGIPGLDLDPATLDLLRAVRPGGILLFRRNVRDAAQVRGLAVALRDLLGPGLHIAADEEGGLVQRFHREITAFPGNMALGAAGVREPAFAAHLAGEQGYWTAVLLRDLGVTVNLAPVLDLATEGANPSAGIRSFGESPALAAIAGAAFVAGSLRGGVAPCAKHFPGLGDATLDSHLDLPVIEGGGRHDQLAPFRAAIQAGVPLVMTSHVVYRSLDAAPATFSTAIVTRLLREEMGHEGAILTDDLEMGAMTRRFALERIVDGALEAGHDVLCFAHSGERARAAHSRILRWLDADPARRRASERSAERLGRLVPRAPAPAPDPARAASVAEAIAGRAITVLWDDARVLPLRRGGRALLLFPRLAAGTPVEDPLRGEETGEELLEALAGAVERHDLPADPGPEDRAAALLRAASHPVTILVLTDARGRRGQSALLQELLASHPRILLLPIRNPFDLELVPVWARASAVLSYGFRPVQLRALARVLLGEVQPYGRLPVTLRPRAPC